MNTGPVFIGGLDRSGKTYMRFMLASHPSFALSKRTDLWPRFYKRFGDLDQADNLDRAFKALADHKHVRSLEPDFQRLRLDFEAGPRSYERLFALLHEQYAVRMDKPRWGDQTELLEDYARLILRVYPDAKFIHMLRDPRDRYDAVLNKSRRRGGVGAATARWLHSAVLAESNQKVDPQRYKVIRYETMVTHPRETMKLVCEFLGEEYHPAMLRMDDVPRFANTKPMDEDDNPTPLTTKYIGRFCDQLPAHEIVFIQKLSWRYMRIFGYLLEPIRFSLLENARFYTFHWFVHSAHRFGWRLHNLSVR
jgi:hypothetical protein